ncbi:GM13599 [Drosophila sechellia]|uniref:GM13599 n=1 Tax=Drosophila sechellia TaxID=7238 RepID=B4IPZ7_DROSE|nr:GM13599 [Drosophila sechellia]
MGNDPERSRDVKTLETLRGMEFAGRITPHELDADMCRPARRVDHTDRKISAQDGPVYGGDRLKQSQNVSEISRTLECWGECDFSGINDQDSMLEPTASTYGSYSPVVLLAGAKDESGILPRKGEQKMVERSAPQMQRQTQAPVLQHPHPQSPHDLVIQQHPHVIHQIPGPQQAPPHPQHPQMVQVLQTPQGNIPMIFPQHFQKLLPSSDGTHQISVDGMPHLMQPNITIPADTSAIISHQNTGWTMRHYVPQPPHQQPALQQQQPQSLDHQVPPASSPMLSQQSSPSSSRTTSPQRDRSLINVPLQAQQQPHQQQQQMRGMSQRLADQKNTRRPSAETTPPPTTIGGEQQHDVIIKQLNALLIYLKQTQD